MTGPDALDIVMPEKEVARLRSREFVWGKKVKKRDTCNLLPQKKNVTGKKKECTSRRGPQEAKNYAEQGK